jgi:chromosome segregation ATPase
VHEFVHAARTKYERLEVELGDALDELELLKKRNTALEAKQLKVTWHIQRAAGRLEEALEEINWVPPAHETAVEGEEE